MVLEGHGAKTYLDECIILPIILFFSSALISYLSLRFEKRTLKMEHLADLFFILGLLSLSILAIALTFEML